MYKKISILIILLVLVGITTKVNAATFEDQFYIAEPIDGIYYKKAKGDRVEYRQAKFKRRKRDGFYAYCLEPFKIIKENSDYIGYDKDYEKYLNLSNKDWERVKLLAYYGYNYQWHIEDKWYPITQILIWQTIDKEANFTWTDGYGGREIKRFEKEIQEIEELVKNHNKKLDFGKEIYNMTINDELIIKDKNNILNQYEIYKIHGLEAEIKNNELIVHSKEEGTGEIELSKKDEKYSVYPTLYVDNVAQMILTPGKFNSLNVKLKIIIESGSIKINKLDEDTNSTISSGEATLVGAEYEVFDNNDNKVGKITIGKDSSGVLNNLKFGVYKIKEKKAGKGYLLDDKTYEITINEDNKDVEINLFNKVIVKPVKITKYFGDNKNGWKLEKGIKFNIYNSKKELIKVVETDEYGKINVLLPYGTYTFHQVNTNNNYQKVEDFSVTVNQEIDDIEYNLKDIKTPDTKENDLKSEIIITNSLLVGSLILKKKYEE